MAGEFAGVQPVCGYELSITRERGAQMSLPFPEGEGPCFSRISSTTLGQSMGHGGDSSLWGPGWGHGGWKILDL
ncbi:Uncharacterized protein HZ326_23895 [Fusarium oxysporum f. sp. albedinis]|nr:Uncharacterized protein HZ326_23895 [Fusarium oxysporum f. sp. albedinis]